MSNIAPFSVPPYIYGPLDNREPDFQYQEMLTKVMDEGEITRSFFGEECRSLHGYELRFKIENGFPLLTERDLSESRFTGALSESLAFLNGARTEEELKKWGCTWWGPWVTAEKCRDFGLEPGDLGPGSYGPGFVRNLPDGTKFNQIEMVIEQIKQFPHARTHRITPWIPELCLGTRERKRQVIVAPCHGWVSFRILPDGRLILIHKQRSADLPVGWQFNLIQYAAMGMYVAQLTGYQFYELVYYIEDAHVYARQYEAVEKLLQRRPFAFPNVTLDPRIKNFSTIRAGHFNIEGYFPHEWFRIDTPV